MKIPEVTKKPYEEFSIGLRYSTPDLDEDETITSVVVSITSDEATPTLVVDGSPTITDGNTVAQQIKVGTANEEYKVIFKIATSAGYKFEDFIYVKVRD